MFISKKVVIPLWDFRLQKKFEDESNSGLYKVPVDLKKSNRNQSDNKSEGPVYKKNVSTYEQMIQKNREEMKAFLQSMNIEEKNISTYEQMIQKNWEEKKAFLQSVTIEEAKINLSNSINSKKGSSKSSKTKVLNSPHVKRKSRRLANLDAEIVVDDSYVKTFKVIAKKGAIIKKAKQIKCRTTLEEFLRKEKNVSTYEQMIQKNCEEKKAFLQSINIEEQNVSTYEQMIQKNQEEKKAFLQSMNIEEKNVSTYEQMIQKNREEKKAFLQSMNIEEATPSEVSFKDVLCDLYEDYVADICIQESKYDAKSITYDKSDLEIMTVAESNIVKITPDIITSLTWYPSSEELIIAAADINGNIGIKKVDSPSNPYLMGIHLQRITNLQFNPFNPVQLISSSNDGILLCGDMVQHKFRKIYNFSDHFDHSITYFDILSEMTFLVTQLFGNMVFVDSRIERCMYLWDLRKIQDKPVAANYQRQAIHSAYFSPVTGNSVLSTCEDDTISIFDTSNLNKMELKQEKKHNNRPEIIPFRATWLPNSDECFAVASKGYPCKIEVYDKNMFPYSAIMHENLTSITSFNVFHPKRLALASADSIGKLFLFT